MLCIKLMTTGSEVARMELKDVPCSTQTETPLVCHVRDLKLHLHKVCGHSRFRQRLLQENGQILPDEAILDAPCRLQLVLLGFAETSADHVEMLHEAVRFNDTRQIEDILQRPQDPDLVSWTGGAALHVAALIGNEVAALQLLEAGANHLLCSRPMWATWKWHVCSWKLAQARM